MSVEKNKATIRRVIDELRKGNLVDYSLDRRSFLCLLPWRQKARSKRIGPIVGGQFLPPQGLPDIFETLTRLTPQTVSNRDARDNPLAPAAIAQTTFIHRWHTALY